MPKTVPAPKSCSSLQTGGSWSTAFYTFPINVDTVNPVVATGPTLSPPPSTNNGVANSYLVGPGDDGDVQLHR